MKITQEKLIVAAKLIRDYCEENKCTKCPFYNRVNWHCGLQKMWPCKWEVKDDEKRES